MKKMILMFVTIVLVLYVAGGSEIKNKGSSQPVNLSNILPALIPDNIDLTAETANWLVQQNSSTVNQSSRTSVLMNNSQNMMWKDIHSKLTQSSLANKSILEPYRLALETCDEVSEIPNMGMIMNSSNTLRPLSTDMVMVQWRQNFADLRTNTTASRISNGANGCNVSIVNLYNFFHSAGYSTAV